MNIEIKSITKIGTEYNTKKFAFTHNHQKLYPKEDEIEIKRIKMKKFAATNNNFKLSKDKIKNSYNNNIMHRQNTFNKLKNKKKEAQNKTTNQIKGQKSTIITPNLNLGNNNINDNSDNVFYNNQSQKKDTKKISKNLSRENMYINASNINSTFNNFLQGGTQRKKISFKENDNKKKNNKILQLYNINNNIYNDEITLINNTNMNDIYTTNCTTKTNNRNSAKQAMMGSGNKIKKDKKIKIINKYNNIEHYIFNPSMKIDTNYINNVGNSSIINNINNNIKKLDIRSGENKIKNNSNLLGNINKKNVVKNIKDIIIENSNKNNINLINSFKSDVNVLNTFNTFNTNDSKKKDSKKKLNKNKIQNLKISQRGPNCNEFNQETGNNLSCKNKNKPKNKVIKLKDVNNNFNYIFNNGIHFNSTVKNSSNNNIYITYINNTSSSKNEKHPKKTGSNICYNNFHINKSNSNLILNSNISKEKINHRNSLIKLNTLQNEEDVKKHIKNINYRSKINFSPPKVPFLKDKNNKKFHLNLRHPYSNKNINENEKINYSPKVNSIPKYMKTESNVANINILNNNNIFINKLDFLENYAISSRKDNIFSKINNYILKGNKSKDNFINLLNKRKLSAKNNNNSRGNSLMKKNESKDKEISLNKKRLRKIEYGSETINITNNNKNSLFNFGVKTTKNLYKKDILLNKKYSFINILKPKTINKLKRYNYNINNKEESKNEEKRKEHIQDNSKLITNNNNKSLTFIYKEKKKTISSLLKQKNFIKLIHMIEELNINNSKLQSKSKKKNKSSQHINFNASSSKKQNKIQENININLKFQEDKNIIDNVIQNNMTMFTIYILSKYEKNFSKIGISSIGLYDKNIKEIFILYSNANINTENNEEENVNYLFNNKNQPFIAEFKENLYINFYINLKKANNLKFVKILNYENKKEEISSVKEIKIYHGKKRLFNGILNIKSENIIDITENIIRNIKSEQKIPNAKKRGNSASLAKNKSNIYNINYINYKKNNKDNTRSFSTFRQNNGNNKNKIPKKQMLKIKSERNISPKAHFIKTSNIYNNTEINEDAYYDNNNNIIEYNACNTIPYNKYNENDNELKDEIYIRERFISESDLDKTNIHEGINLNKLNLNNYIDSSKFTSIYQEEKENNDINMNYVQFKIIRMILSSNYGNNNSIGLTGLEFYDKNNKLINIEIAETIGALPKDLHTVYNDENDNRIFENIFNGENNTDDSFNMWLTLFDSNKNNNEKNTVLPYIELSFKEMIYLSKIKFYNYNHINQLDKCLKTVDIFLDNKFFAKIHLRQGLGIVPNDNIIHKKHEINERSNDKMDYSVINDYGQDITFPLNNKYYERLYTNKNKYEDFIYNEEEGLNIDYSSLKYQQCYETPFMPNGCIIRFQLVNNFLQGKVGENNNNKTTNNINNISLRNNNYIGIKISSIYDEHGNDLLSQNENKYKIVGNKEIIILDQNKYILYYTSNDDNNNLFFLFETPVSISYIEIKPFSFSDSDNKFFHSVKDIKIFCDTDVIFEGELYQYQPTIILFTSDNKLLEDINPNYLTKYHINRNYSENKTDEYYSMTFT